MSVRNRKSAQEGHLTPMAGTGGPRAYAKLAERLGAGGEWKLEIEAAAELAGTPSSGS